MILEGGIQVSLDGTTWYQLTDHNRKDIQANPTLIEKQQRMASGKMRKYVIASKNVISTSWDMLPSKTALTVDGHYSSAWLEAFYEANVFLPVFVKIVSSKDTIPTIGTFPADSTFVTAKTGSKIYQTYITKFSTTITDRTQFADYVTMNIEFTEI
jgi:hypothetical protein